MEFLKSGSYAIYGFNNLDLSVSEAKLSMTPGSRLNTASQTCFECSMSSKNILRLSFTNHIDYNDFGNFFLSDICCKVKFY